MPKQLSEILADAFKYTQSPTDLTRWVDSQPMQGQGMLFCEPEAPAGKFCDEVNSEFRVEYTGNLRVEHPVK